MLKLSQGQKAVVRYILVVATIYLLAFVGILAYFGAFSQGLSAELLIFWPVIPGAAAIAILGTLVPMARFGAAGGSVFVIPTVLHIFLILALVISLFDART